MDRSTLIGIVSGVLLLGVSLFVGSGWQIFFSLTSFLIVMGGTVASTLINFPMSDVAEVMKISQKALKNHSVEPEAYIETIVELSKKARANGLLSIEQDLKRVDEEFLRSGLQQVVNGAEPEDLNRMLQAELGLMGQRHRIGQKIFQAMGEYAPAYGMIGTLIGLIKMLQNLNDPASIGPGMALAMVTTFYGALFANLLFLPMAGKLKKRSEEEILFKQMLLQGILALQAEESPRVIKNRLVTYLAPKNRNGAYSEKGTGHE